MSSMPHSRLQTYINTVADDDAHAVLQYSRVNDCLQTWYW
jgi:hypothetical protein